MKYPALELLKIVIEKQIKLICEWMRVGFVHGVMNTDNMAISGETIDYGPCAFMDNYDPRTVFSSIDYYGRYAYCNQPLIAKWNLERFAESLISLIKEDKKEAIKIATDVINEFPEKYKNVWLKMMQNKLGIIGENPKDKDLFIELLSWMHQNKADYTNTFCYLMNELKNGNKIYKDKQFIKWKKKWQERCKSNNNSPENSIKMMRNSNPLIIPRNHKVEEALSEAEKDNDFSKVKKLVEIFKNPYKKIFHMSIYQDLPSSANVKYKTYCGT